MVPVGFPMQIPPFPPFVCASFSPAEADGGRTGGPWFLSRTRWEQIFHFSFGLYMKRRKNDRGMFDM